MVKKYNLIFRLQIEYDVRFSVEWYQHVNADLAAELQKEIKIFVNLIEQNPLLYQVRYRNIRICFLKKFPYGIHFIIDKQEIIVLRILHTKRFFK